MKTIIERQITLEPRHSLHFIYRFLTLRILSPTLYNHQSTHLPLPLLFLPVASWWLQTHSPTVGKSKYSYTLVKVSCFYGLKNPGYLTSRAEFCGTVGRSSLQAIKQGLSRRSKKGGTNDTPTSVRSCNIFWLYSNACIWVVAYVFITRWCAYTVTVFFADFCVSV